MFGVSFNKQNFYFTSWNDIVKTITVFLFVDVTVYEIQKLYVPMTTSNHFSKLFV